MEQDDECILSLIRKQFLLPPSGGPLNLEQPDVENQSMGQAQEVLKVLNNKVCIISYNNGNLEAISLALAFFPFAFRMFVGSQKKGFFIECGALDGETRSNTLYMERNLDWEGILIEGDPHNFQMVTKKKRKAWTVPACLSKQANPQ